MLRGEALYVDDVPLQDALHAVFVRSPVAHARIAEIDTGGVPEGVEVFTSAEVDLEPGTAPFGPVRKDMVRPRLADGTVRFVGDAVAVVVAETRADALDAAELVLVDYDPLPVVVDAEEALRGEVLLFPEHGTNVCAEWLDDRDESFFDGCEVVVSGRLRSARLAPAPLEPRAVAAAWDGERLTAWLSTQWPHGDKDRLAEALGLEPEQVRVIAPDVGGGFGAKVFGGAESIVVAWLARRLERPVRWVETRSESMLALGHGRGMVLDYELGGSRDGRLRAYRLRTVQDAGAYPDVGSFLPALTRLMATGVYDIPRVEYEGRSVVTNTAPTVAYRGAGRPEAAQAIERAVDRFAAEVGVDPAEVRRRSFLQPDAFPLETPTGAAYDSGEYEQALDLLLDAAGYGALRDEQRDRREREDSLQLGIGLSVYVEITNGGGSSEWGEVEITRQGGAIVRTGLSPHGQGHGTGLAMIASERLGIPIASIEVVHGDTDLVPSGGGTAGSRSLQTGGVAVGDAAAEVAELGRARAAEELEAALADVVLDTGRGVFHVTGSPEPAVGWAELASADGDALRADVEFDPSNATYPFGAHLALVEVDTETGFVELLRLVAVDDAGRILNPLLAEGQRHGGIAQGAAHALYEEFLYDEDGNPTNLSLAEYPFPSPAELPSFELVTLETPTPINALGAKGIGESGTIGATPAVLNAVIDALAPFGVRELQLPTTPERVWRAIHDNRV